MHYACADQDRARSTRISDNAGSPQFPNAKAFIVIDDVGRTQIPFSIDQTGTSGTNWRLDDNNDRTLFNAIATGDRFLLAIAEPVVAHAVNAGDVNWSFDVPEPTVRHTRSHTVDAGDISWTFDIPQPTVTHSTSQPGTDTRSMPVTCLGPSMFHSLPSPIPSAYPDAHAVNAGDVAWTFDVPQPTVTHTVFGPQDYTIDAGPVEWVFDIPQPTVTHVPKPDDFRLPAATRTLTPINTRRPWNSRLNQAAGARVSSLLPPGPWDIDNIDEDALAYLAETFVADAWHPTIGTVEFRREVVRQHFP